MLYTAHMSLPFFQMSGKARLRAHTYVKAVSLSGCEAADSKKQSVLKISARHFDGCLD
jgi:hypothetical protein